MMNMSRCKMCGGNIEYETGTSVAVCDSCGTKQTLPTHLTDRLVNLYDRANHYRRNNEFDKASDIYNQILDEDRTDAEAYWSLVLCNYGIEYVEDARTRKRVPTVNRAQYTSIYMDENYKEAIRYADSLQRAVYEEEAKEIDRIQKEILAISQQEEPFDVFICYKETDDAGRRTRDSVYANDIYFQLQREGLKVFFARITLEDKLGTDYEPYIFAALNSAKVMIVVGTKPEYFKSPWVKNEWSRYLALVRQSFGNKTLIPAYKDMDPYELPEEFSHLQALDMGRLGFLQDLVHGVKKIIGTSASTQTQRVYRQEPPQEESFVDESSIEDNPKLVRAFIFLEDGFFEKAGEYLEAVLDEEPENAYAYLGKLMVTLKVQKRENLGKYQYMFEADRNCQKVLRFGSAALKEEMNGYIAEAYAKYGSNRLVPDYTKANPLERSYSSSSQAPNNAMAGNTVYPNAAQNSFENSVTGNPGYGNASYGNNGYVNNGYNDRSFGNVTYNQSQPQQASQPIRQNPTVNSEKSKSSIFNWNGLGSISQTPNTNTAKTSSIWGGSNFKTSTDVSNTSPKSKSVAMLLCVLSLFGIGGLHRFYVGKNGTGLLHLFTLGFYWIGTLIDLVAISNGEFKDADGNYLR